MVVEKDVKDIVKHLARDEVSTIYVFGNPIDVSVVDHGGKFMLTSSVYEGGNYIPPSVRLCLTKRPQFYSSLNTFLKVDEDRYHVSLHYQGNPHEMDEHNFKFLLEEFGSLTEEWRQYLDEHDRNDLVGVIAK